MTISINIPDELAVKLQSKAETQNVSPESLAIDILTNALETGSEPRDYPTPEEVVAKIKAAPPNPAAIRPAVGSLAEALRQAPSDPDFDLDIWTEEWAVIEAEQKAAKSINTAI